MSFEKIKNTILSNKLYKALIFILLIITLIFYFKIFFTVGVKFEDTFLKKEVVSSDSNYIGRSAYGNIHITVKGIKDKDSSADVIYSLPNNILRQYTVDFKDSNDWDLGITNIKDKDGNIIFEGEYISGFLFDKNGKPLMDTNIQILMDGESPYNANYKVSLYNVVNMVYSSNDIIRGKFEFLIIAVIIFLFTLVDIKVPLFFFTLRHLLDCKDPEPSDFYITMQRISWYVNPIIGIILMIVAIMIVAIY